MPGDPVTLGGPKPTTMDREGPDFMNSLSEYNCTYESSVDELQHDVSKKKSCVAFSPMLSDDSISLSL